MQSNMSQKLDKLKENWPQKILALIIAIMLYAFYQIAQLETKILSVPLEVRTNGSLVQNSDVQRTIRLSVRGKPEDISQIDETDFLSYIDCSYVKEPGFVELPINLEKSPRAQKIQTLEIQIKPQKINIDLEERAIATVPIDANVYGTVKEGFEVVSISTEPTFLQISGSQPIVKSIHSFVTDPIIIDGLDSSIEKKVSIVNKNKLIHFESEVSPLITIKIAEIIDTSTLDLIPISLLNTSHEFDFELSIDSTQIMIEGTYNKIKDFELSPLYFATVDCSSIREEGVYTLPITFPYLQGIKIVDSLDESVDVIVTKHIYEPQSE